MAPSTAVKTEQPGQVDLSALKTKQHGAWSSGDYAIVGTTLQIVGEELCEALDLGPARRCSTSPPATAMPRLPQHGAGATWSPPTMCRACSSAAARAPRPKVCR